MKLKTAVNFNKKVLTIQAICVNQLNFFEHRYGIVSHKVQFPNINDECVKNASEATPRICSILGVFWGICGESTEGVRGHPCRSVISIKMHSSSFARIMHLHEVFPCQFAACFWGTLSWDGL